MSNFTDFNFLEQLPEVNLFYAASPEDIDEADIVILPGSKNTISDMLFLQKQGMANAVKKAHEQGKAVYGICGGFQMMGESIADPDHVEGQIEKVPGLGILPVETILTEEKVTEQCTFTFQNGEAGKGYEIHMGETIANHESPACLINGAKQDGYYKNERTWGTYIHGIFDNISVVNRILKDSGKQASTQMDFQQFKETQYDKLAQLIRENVNMEYIYKSMEIE